jgi:predicted Fe-S protein YdhL (DUF1289 family)
MSDADPRVGRGTELQKEPESPCISVCALDENDICMGCYRSASEITDWFMADVGEKREIVRAPRHVGWPTIRFVCSD